MVSCGSQRERGNDDKRNIINKKSLYLFLLALIIRIKKIHQRLATAVMKAFNHEIDRVQEYYIFNVTQFKINLYRRYFYIYRYRYRLTIAIYCHDFPENFTIPNLLKKISQKNYHSDLY